MIENIGNHYVYRHIRKDTGEPFYIGIGTKSDKQSEYHRANSKHKRNDFWKSVVNKADYEVEILLESNDYDFIKQKEIEFIALYGRRDLGKGTLVNMTDGGDGFKNYMGKEETYKKISKALTGRKLTEQDKNRRKINRKPIPPPTKEHIQNLKKAGKKRKEEKAKTVLNKEYITNEGYLVKVIEYINSKNVTIQFEDGNIVYNKLISEVKRGCVKNPNHKGVYNIGFLGSTRVTNNKAYSTWFTLLKDYREKVVEAWHNFQNFLKWFETNYKPNTRLVVILSKEEKEISNNNVFLLPEEFCGLFLIEKGYRIRNNKYITSSFRGKQIGTFSTIKEAIEAYSKVKKDYLIELIEKHYHNISNEAYNKIKNYKIEIYGM